MGRPRCIGIVACSAEGAALCYRTICAEGPTLYGPHAHPDVALHSLSFADYVACLDHDDWQGVADLMMTSAQQLAKAGAGFLICPDNTIHQALPLVVPRSPLPWLHIAEVVAEQAVGRGFQTDRRHRHAMARRWPCLSRKARGARLSYVLPTAAERARDQPHHHGGAGLVLGSSSQRRIAYHAVGFRAA